MHEPCTAQTGPIWKLGGESCGCVLPADHVRAPLDATIDGHTARDHRCGCGSWWVDSIRVDRRTAP